MRLAALAAAIALLLLRVLDPEPVQGLRHAYFDNLQQLWPRPVASEASAIVIIDIDDASLEKIGQWPWPRTRLADLVERCAAAGAVAAGFDVLFSEPDRTSPQHLAASMTHWPAATRAALRTLPDHDQALAASFSALPVVLAMAGQPQGDPPPAAALPVQTALGGDPVQRVMKFPGVLSSLPELTAAAAGLGWISLAPSVDGVVRQAPLLAAHGDRVFPALSIELLRIALGGKGWIALMSDAGLEQLAFQTEQGELTIPLDPNGLHWVHYTRPGAAAETIPAWRVLAGEADAALRGRLILVGSSALGFNDLHPTPASPRLPGIEVHANILDTILQGQFLVRPSWALGAELGGLALLALLLWRTSARCGPLGWAALVGGAALALAALGVGLFRAERWLIDVSYPLVFLLCLGALWGAAIALRLFNERQRIRLAFRQYLAPELVERLSRSSTPPQLGGESREMTILFCDIRGFTRLSENLPPERLGALMNRYLSEMSEVVMRHGGTIDKYIGDCIMAFWNAPLEDPQHARHACEAALALRAALPEINRQLRERGLLADDQAVRIGIGIHTGTVAVGNFGSQQRFDYTVLGDGVNVAARMEALCKTHGRDILVSRAVKERAPGIAMEALGASEISGKRESVEIFAL